MYMNIKIIVKVEIMRSELFGVKLRVNQGLIISHLLFAVVIDEVTKEIREDVVKKLLYTNDLVLFKKSWKWNFNILDGREH